MHGSTGRTETEVVIVDMIGLAVANVVVVCAPPVRATVIGIEAKLFPVGADGESALKLGVEPDPVCLECDSTISMGTLNSFTTDGPTGQPTDGQVLL